MRYAATGDKAVLAGVPEADREFVTGLGRFGSFNWGYCKALQFASGSEA